MLTGRKLLLADDSAAIRKVIELTFSDEGMEVITVGDGRAAFEKMGVGPDLVLADVYMPEIDGYELCRSIKQDARYAKTPVVLLISSFEPFDEAEARRVGADDVVTKPFQSIRQLVSRVGSLLNKGQGESEMSHQYSTLGMSENEPVVTAPLEQQPSEPHVTVMVEAPMMDHVESAEPAGVSCSTDLELQTADTMRLDRIADVPVDEAPVEDLSLVNTIESELVAASPDEEHLERADEPQSEEFSFRGLNEPMVETQPAPSMKSDDSVLDLEDEYLGEPQMVSDDVFLDLDFADTAPVQRSDVHSIEAAEVDSNQTFFVQPESEVEEASTAANETWLVQPELSAESQVAGVVDFNQESVFEEPSATVVSEELSSQQPVLIAEPWTAPAAEEQPAPLMANDADQLSPAAIDAIARRMVEQMSDKVVREIAWEVVPELSELLIKQKLSEAQ